MTSQPPRPPWSLSLAVLLVIAAVFCFGVAALEAFDAFRIPGAPWSGFMATGLALWAAAGLA